MWADGYSQNRNQNDITYSQSKKTWRKLFKMINNETETRFG
jgi:hypothetical protein